VRIELFVDGRKIFDSKADSEVPPTPNPTPPPPPPPPTSSDNLQSKDVPCPGGFTFTNTRPVQMSWSALPGPQNKGLLAVSVDGVTQYRTAFSVWGANIPPGRHSVVFSQGTLLNPLTLRVDTLEQ
jgi:hypothetical protein